MASYYENQADGTIALKSSTFAERKAARRATADQVFVFEVVAAFPLSGEVVGQFSCKSAAMDFAFGQRGALVGNTAAARVLCERHPSAFIATSQSFRVERVNTTTGARVVCPAP